MLYLGTIDTTSDQWPPPRPNVTKAKKSGKKSDALGIYVPIAFAPAPIYTFCVAMNRDKQR
jgi:hypothetical protein